MSREIAVNSTTLKSEVNTMTQALQQLRAEIEDAYAATRELDNMWDGPANAEFQDNFNMDRMVLLEICDGVEKLIGSMGNARTEYEKCETDVKAIVDSIKF